MALTKVTKRVIADSSITSSMIVNGAINASHLTNVTTDDLNEGGNLYYTTLRSDSDFDARLALKTTDDLTEGSNLYYTTLRVDSAIADYLSGSFSVGDITASTLTVTGNALLSDSATVTNTLTFGSLSDGTITITGFVDEDDMASNSATLVPTQQSTKEYTDTTANNTAVAMAIALG